MNTLILKGGPATGHQEFHTYLKNLERKLEKLRHGSDLQSG